MKKIFYLLLTMIAIIFLITILQYNGYLFINNKTINPSDQINLEQFDNNKNSSSNYSIFTNITNKIKDIEGIESIDYEIFITNNSMDQIIQYYSTQLESDGYSISLDNSGITPSEYFEMNYYTYIKGVNGVVIFIKTHENQTWFFYSSGSIFEYQKIIDNLGLN